MSNKPVALSVLSPVATLDSDAARKNKRLVVLALEDYFDEATRRYRDQHSDQSVANELDLAPIFVAKVREEFYGKMAEPTEIESLRSDLAALMATARNIETRLADLSKRNGWA